MKYKMVFFNKAGAVIHACEVKAKSHRQAMGANRYSRFALVISASGIVRRYHREQVCHKDIHVQKTTFKHRPAILLIGDMVEVYSFTDEKTRNEALCSTFTPAESANPGKEQSDTIVCSEETSDSKSGSMFPKTLNGCATNATWLEKLIRLSTDVNFGEISAEDLAAEEWSGGWKVSHSSYKYTISNKTKATVKKGKLIGGEGTELTLTKRDLGTDVGHIFRFMLSEETGNWKQIDGKGYYVPPHWIDFEYDKVSAKVKPTEVGAQDPNKGYEFVESQVEYIGKVLKFEVVDHLGIKVYKYRGWNFSPEWLDFEDGVS
jgi:hypothetical protein